MAPGPRNPYFLDTPIGVRSATQSSLLTPFAHDKGHKDAFRFSTSESACNDKSKNIFRVVSKYAINSDKAERSARSQISLITLNPDIWRNEVSNKDILEPFSSTLLIKKQQFPPESSTSRIDGSNYEFQPSDEPATPRDRGKWYPSCVTKCFRNHFKNYDYKRLVDPLRQRFSKSLPELPKVFSIDQQRRALKIYESMHDTRQDSSTPGNIMMNLKLFLDFARANRYFPAYPGKNPEVENGSVLTLKEFEGIQKYDRGIQCTLNHEQQALETPPKSCKHRVPPSVVINIELDEKKRRIRRQNRRHHCSNNRSMDDVHTATENHMLSTRSVSPCRNREVIANSCIPIKRPTNPKHVKRRISENCSKLRPIKHYGKCGGEEYYSLSSQSDVVFEEFVKFQSSHKVRQEVPHKRRTKSKFTNRFNGYSHGITTCGNNRCFEGPCEALLVEDFTDKDKLQSVNPTKRKLNEAHILNGIKKRIDDDLKRVFLSSDVSSLEPIVSSRSEDSDMSFYSVIPCLESFRASSSKKSPPSHNALECKNRNIPKYNNFINNSTTIHNKVRSHSHSAYHKKHYLKSCSMNMISINQAEFGMTAKSTQSMDSGVMTDCPQNDLRELSRGMKRNLLTMPTFRLQNIRSPYRFSEERYLNEFSDSSCTDDASVARRVDSAVKKYTEELIRCERRARGKVGNSSMERAARKRKRKKKQEIAHSSRTYPSTNSTCDFSKTSLYTSEEEQIAEISPPSLVSLSDS